MEILDTNVYPSDEQFKANAAHHRALAEQLRERLAEVREGGDAVMAKFFRKGD